MNEKLTIEVNTGRTPLASLTTVSDVASVLENPMLTRGAEDALFLEEATIVERGRMVGIVWVTRLVFAGALSSAGIGYIEILPDADREAKIGESALVDTEKVRASESRGIDADALPSVEVPFSTSHTYR